MSQAAMKAADTLMERYSVLDDISGSEARQLRAIIDQAADEKYAGLVKAASLALDQWTPASEKWLREALNKIQEDK